LIFGRTRGPWRGADWAEDYSIALAGEPEGRYLWILSRTPTISDEVRDVAISDLQGMEYDTEALYWTEQAR